MARQFYAPWGYAPRRRRSARLVIIWMAVFVLAGWTTWYISTRQRERAAPYIKEFLRPGSGFQRAGGEQEQVADEGAVEP
ncbi:hypothetical protein MMYC01_202100 [Madurella mycetomatis]|uniref:Uncharacterized protein n=1 Tax=Madurella mycetomatis TaxID=100816 RepID=A0A175WAD1_9PEZI|nr:hypothetical protein MMYC01_202100 [Madurella mycetomatis]